MHSLGEWDQLISDLPGVHLFQTVEWAEFKQRFGWQNHTIIEKSQDAVVAAAMVLSKSVRLTRFGPELRILYSPRGPMVDWTNLIAVDRILERLEEFYRKENAIFIKIDPEFIYSYGDGQDPDSVGVKNYLAVEELLRKRGWRYSSDQVQFKNTVLLDLKRSEDSLLGAMKQKTRYNIRLAEKKGVKVRAAQEGDFDRMFQIYAETSLRDGFAIRSKEYYIELWSSFIKKGMAVPLVAEFEGQMIAGVFLFMFAEKAWYLYGMSTNQHREKMPNYLLQWEAIRLAKSKGIAIYDLWGAPDDISPEDRMWGVYRFKEGLGGKLARTPGAWDYTEQPLSYYGYTKIMPRIMAILRWRGKSRIITEAGV